MAIYNPMSFSFIIGSCTYNYGPVQINNVNSPNLVAAKSIGACSAFGSCFKSFWLSVSSNGIFTFVDQSATGEACELFLAYAINGSKADKGVFAVAAVAMNGQTTWAPSEMFGTFDKVSGGINMTVRNCTGLFMVNPSSLEAGLLQFEAPPPAPGSAIAGYVDATPPSCQTNPCATSGIFLAWGASGSFGSSAARP